MLLTGSNKTAASSKHYNDGIAFHFHFADGLALHAVSFNQGVPDLHFIPLLNAPTLTEVDVVVCAWLSVCSASDTSSLW